MSLTASHETTDMATATTSSGGGSSSGDGGRNVDFERFLSQFKVQKGTASTHTRLTGGNYVVPDEDWEDFMHEYYNLTAKVGRFDYLTEKQLTDDGPLLGDFDLHYAETVKTRQHTKNHVMDMVDVYAQELNYFYDIPTGTSVDVFVMERETPYPSKNKVKDGLHMIFGMTVARSVQMLVRQRVIPHLTELWDNLPVTNAMTGVVDDCITKGNANWQLYGSRKPGCMPYLVKYHFVIRYEANENDDVKAKIEEADMRRFDAQKSLLKLSARYRGYPKFHLRGERQADVEKQLQHMAKRQPSAASALAAANGAVHNSMFVPANLYNNVWQWLDFSTITSAEILDKCIEVAFRDPEPKLYKMKETHEFTVALPEKYYGPGSYGDWIRVGWALCNTSQSLRLPDTLFLSWLKLSSQDNCRQTLRGANNKFDWGLGVRDMMELWAKFRRDGNTGLTHRSIMYWCKTENRVGYDRIMDQTVDHFVDEVFKKAKVTEYDMANVLYHMHKDRFVCVNIKSDSWYQFVNNRWVECGTANELRHSISKDLRILFSDKLEALGPALQDAQVHHIENETVVAAGQNQDNLQRSLANTAGDVVHYCGRTTWKNNIMREARELFFDKEFVERLDTNVNLMCFSNGIVDIKEKCFRTGQPDDCVSLCTNVEYIPYEEAVQRPEMEEIETFMSQLFPEEDLRNYMWQHMASLVVGNNVNQTFHLYKGTGRNGKSALVDLLSEALGDYKAQVPISWLTSKRGNIGGATPELAQLPGRRYAVMQEPEKGAKIQEGVLKEITGGDPVQARALFQQSFTFKPQFKLVVCTNYEFEDMAGDDGTWRRIRMVDFKAKFMPNPFQDERFPREECEWQFQVDTELDQKFPQWAPVLMAKLVHMAFELQGKVEDCEMVLASSARYRERQDYFTQFVKDNLRKKDGEKLTKTVAWAAFKQWYIENYSKTTLPKGREFYEFMERKFGVYSRCWKNLYIYDDNAADAE